MWLAGIASRVVGVVVPLQEPDELRQAISVEANCECRVPPALLV